MLEPCHAGGDQALNERCQLLLVLGKEMRNSPAETGWLGVRDEQLALYDAIRVELAFDTDRLVRG
jgi:hypothetical protein